MDHVVDRPVPVAGHGLDRRHSLDRGTDLLGLRPRQAPGRQPYRLGFHDPPHGQDLHDVLDGHRIDDENPTFTAQEPFALQSSQRFPHRSPGESEPLGQPPVLNDRSTAQLARQKHGPKLLAREIGQSVATLGKGR
jgi:hypothetical protein